MNNLAETMNSKVGHQEPRPVEIRPGLDALLKDIHALEALVAGWNEQQANTVEALRRADGALHKEAFSRLIRAVKQAPGAMAALKEAVGDEVVYAVLRHLEIIKPSLHERVEQALESVRPFLVVTAAMWKWSRS